MMTTINYFYRILFFVLFFLPTVSEPLLADNLTLPSVEKDSLKAKKPTLFDELYGVDIREVFLQIDLQQVMDNRTSDDSVEGQFSYTVDGGEQENRSVKVQVRGKTRRRVCDFPPLRLKFKKKELKKDSLRKFNTIKLVTHCLESDEGMQNVLKEYLTYKIYNRITDHSFRVQLLWVNYVDVRDSTQSFRQLGFIIENDIFWGIGKEQTTNSTSKGLIVKLNKNSL